MPDAIRTGPGAKAAMLCRLQEAGFRVPKFVVSPTDINEAIHVLGLPVAVRSSAAVEDGEETSFAGQFRSFLNLSTVEEVLQAIHDCCDSDQSAHVLNYCRRNGIDPDRLHVEVIVQRMVQPELAGVAFTQNPMTGAEEVVIEACEGLADALLAGKQESLSAGHPLLEQYRPAIEKVARDIQRYLGAPQDIEFAVESGVVYILQSRPITRIEFADQPGEWTNADFRDGGVSSGVCSPLMWSLYEMVWDRTLKGTLQELKLFRQDFQAGRMFFGRPYWNVGAVKDCLLQLPGFVERNFDNDLNIEITYEDDGRKTPFTLRGLWRALPTILALPRFFRRQEKFDRAYLYEGFENLLRQHQGSPHHDPISRFRDLIENAFLVTESNYFRTIFAASLAKMDFSTSFPDVDYAALVTPLPPLRHTLPIRAVQQLPVRDDESLAGIIQRHRHHYRLGLDVRFPRWDEDCEFVMEMLREVPAMEAKHEQPACRQTSQPRGRKLERLRAFVWLREEMRDLSSQLYYLLRRYALAIGRRWGIGDDIFFMTFRQILSDDRSQIEQQRAVFESFRNFKAPNEIGSRWPGCSATYKPVPQMSSRSNVLRGIGASSGTANGRAYIAHNVQEALAMPRGDILVCPFTDPGWTPVLDRAAAVVTETGGLLSHAAVICREFGIPAVLGIRDATSVIRSDMKLVVNGTTGIVEVADTALEWPADSFSKSVQSDKCKVQSAN